MPLCWKLFQICQRVGFVWLYFTKMVMVMGCSQFYGKKYNVDFSSSYIESSSTSITYRCHFFLSRKVWLFSKVKNKFNIAESLCHSKHKSLKQFFWKDRRNWDRLKKDLIQFSSLLFLSQFIFNFKKYDRISEKIRQLNWLNMHYLFKSQMLNLIYKLLKTSTPTYLRSKLTFRSDVHNISIRKTIFQRWFTYNAAKCYNEFFMLISRIV